MSEELVDHVIQDGADFYIMDGPEPNDGSDRRVIKIVRYEPGIDGDGDIEGAERARNWFETEVVNLYGLGRIVWE